MIDAGGQLIVLHIIITLSYCFLGKRLLRAEMDKQELFRELMDSGHKFV